MQNIQGIEIGVLRQSLIFLANWCYLWIFQTNKSLFLCYKKPYLHSGMKLRKKTSRLKMKKWKSLRNVALTSQYKCRCSSEEDGDVIKRRYDVWWLAYSTLYIYKDYYILYMLTKNHVCVPHSKLVTGCASKLLVWVNIHIHIL